MQPFGSSRPASGWRSRATRVLGRPALRCSLLGGDPDTRRTWRTIHNYKLSSFLSGFQIPIDCLAIVVESCSILFADSMQFLGSVSIGLFLHEFFGCTHNRRLIPQVAANGFNLTPHSGVGNVFTVPRHSMPCTAAIPMWRASTSACFGNGPFCTNCSATVVASGVTANTGTPRTIASRRCDIVGFPAAASCKTKGETNSSNCCRCVCVSHHLRVNY